MTLRITHCESQQTCLNPIDLTGTGNISNQSVLSNLVSDVYVPPCCFVKIVLKALLTQGDLVYVGSTLAAFSL